MLERSVILRKRKFSDYKKVSINDIHTFYFRKKKRRLGTFDYLRNFTVYTKAFTNRRHLFLRKFKLLGKGRNAYGNVIRGISSEYRDLFIPKRNKKKKKLKKSILLVSPIQHTIKMILNVYI